MCHSLYEMQPSRYLREAEERLRAAQPTGPSRLPVLVGHLVARWRQFDWRGLQLPGRLRGVLR